MKFIKKLLFGIIIASLLFTAAYFFFKYYNPDFNSIQTYQTYTNYIICLYISIILVYFCITSDKKIAKLAIPLLLLINFGRLMFFFTKDILGLSTLEFYILGGLLIIGFLISQIKFQVRYPLIIIVGIPFIIILANHILPLYPNKPDIEGFEKKTEITLFTITKDDEKTLQEVDTKITIETQGEDIQTQTIYAPYEDNVLEGGKKITSKTFGKDLLLSGIRILFSSKTQLSNTYAHILLPKGEIISLPPQTAIELHKTATPDPRTSNLNIIQGPIYIYFPESQLGSIIITGDVSKIFINETGNIQQIIDIYLQRRNDYLIKQIGGNIMLNPTIDNALERYLNFANSTIKIIQDLCTLVPLRLGNLCAFKTFDQNILNYNEFHSYLTYETSNKAEYINTTKNETLLNQTTKGYETTMTNSRITTIRDTINSRLGK